MSTFVSISGGAKDDYTVYGRGTVIAGNGNYSIDITGKGKVIVGSGHDTLTLGHGGQIWQFGASGMDTINIGSGNYTIYEQGHATVTGAFGEVTINGGVLTIDQHGQGHYQHGQDHDQQGQDQDENKHGQDQHGRDHGYATLMGASAHSEFMAGSHHVLPHDGTDNRGSSSPTVHGGSTQSNTLFEVLQPGGHFVIGDFVSGQDQLYIEGYSLSYLQSHHDISTSGGNTLISLDGGKTTIELQGVTSLKASDITTHHH
jgi:hypothetical protein